MSALAEAPPRRRVLAIVGALMLTMLLALTETGTRMRERLLGARRRRLASLVADWEPEAPEVDAMIARLSEELERSASA